MIKTYAGIPYEEIVRRYADDITRLCVVWTQNEEAAKDCFQNTFLKLYMTKKSFREEEHIKAWLFKVARNECRDYHKQFWNRNVDTSPSKAFWRKYGSIAAMIGFFLLCFTSVTVAAMKSTAFQTWLENIFGSGNVKEVVLTTPTALPTADVKARDNTVPFQENTMVAGEKESFVCEYHFVGDEEQIDQVYTVVSDGLKKMTPSTFEGEYNGTKFGFQYVISGNEIFAFNYTGGMSEVFFYYDKDTVYGARTDGDKKEYLLKINLSQNTVEKISNDHMLCNFVMSPSGTKLLCNHRGDAYWSVFDVKTHTEKKIDTALVNGYATTRFFRLKKKQNAGFALQELQKQFLVA